MTWSAPTTDGGSAVLGYEVQIDDRSGQSVCASSFSDSATLTVLSTSATFTSVPGTAYCLRVRAINAKGNSGWAQAGPVGVTELTEPGDPRSVAGASRARGELTVTWSAPTDDGGSPITSYTVEIDDRSGESGCASSFKKSASKEVTATSATFTGLTGTGYCVRVEATSDEGDSGWAQAGVVAMVASVPGAPRNVEQDGESKTSIDVKWEDPSDDGGAAITDYVVEFRKQGASTWAVFADGVSDATVATVTGLTKGTTYEFRVAASELGGPGCLLRRS